MGNPTTFYIHGDTLAWALDVVSCGRFRSLSDMIDYSIGLYHDTIGRDGLHSVPKLPKATKVKKAVRVNEHVLDSLLETGFFDRGEVAEYALRFYREWLGQRHPIPLTPGTR